MSDDPGRQDLVYDFDLAAPPERVWQALTVPALLECWLLPVANGTGLVFEGRTAGLGDRIETEVLEAEPPRYLRWRWQEANAETGVVSFTLEANDNGGTALRLVHERRAPVAMQAANANPVTMLLAA